MLAQLALTAALIACAVTLVGWIEDVAAGRMALHLRRIPDRMFGGAVAVSLLGLGMPVAGGQVAAPSGGSTPPPWTIDIPAPSSREALSDAAFATTRPAAAPSQVADLPVPPANELAFIVPMESEPAPPPTAAPAPPTRPPTTRARTAPARTTPTHTTPTHTTPARTTRPTSPPTTTPPSTTPSSTTPSSTTPSSTARPTSPRPTTSLAVAATRRRAVTRPGPTTLRSVTVATPDPTGSETTIAATPTTATTGAPTATSPTATSPTATSPTATSPTTSARPSPIASTSTSEPRPSTAARAVPPTTTASPRPTPAPPTSPPSSAARSLDAGALQTALDAWRAGTQPRVSAVMVVIRAGNETWASTSSDGPVAASFDPAGRVAAASITKTFTAALILREVEKGTIRLDDPVPQIEGMSPAPAGVTVRRLLTHSSGLTDYRDAPGYSDDMLLGPRDALALSLAAPLRARPGTSVRYSNAGYLYLGLLLEQVTGRGYGELVNELAATAGMAPPTVESTPRIGWIGFSSGGVVSTGKDLAIWGQALFTPGRILSAASLTEMTTLGELNIGLGAWPSCPCWTDATGQKRSTAIGHTTAIGGLFHFPKTGVTMFVQFAPEADDAVSLMSALERALG